MKNFKGAEIRELRHALKLNGSCFLAHDKSGTAGQSWDVGFSQIDLDKLTPHQASQRIERMLAEYWDFEKLQWRFYVTPNAKGKG